MKSRGFKMIRIPAKTKAKILPYVTFLGIVAFAVIAFNGCQPYRESVYEPSGRPGGAIPQVSYKKTFQQRGFYYTVAKGDTISKISRAFGVDTAQIIKINKLDSTGTIEIGQSLFIPTSSSGTSHAPASASIRTPIRLKGGPLRFVLPLRGESSLKNNQLYITARDSITVTAAEEGMVTYAGYLKGYGETLIVEHRQGFSTVYSNLSTRLKSTNQRVAKGENIAEVARSGNGKVLQFQLRKSGEMVNPLKYVN